MGVREAISALRSGWWAVLVATLVCGVIALTVSLLEPRQYVSSTQLFVSTTDANSATAIYQGGQFSQQRVASYAQLIEGEELARRVARELSLNVDPKTVSEEISATAVTDTVLLNVDVRDASPERARDIASAAGSQFVSLVAQLETPNSGGSPPVKVTVVDQPDLPSAPSSPQTVRNTLIGLVLGIMIGAGLAILRSRLDRSVREVEQAVALTGAPVVGTIVRSDTLEEHHIFERDSGGRTPEEYRQLRTNLQFLNVDEPPRVIMVSSAVPSEGKTTLVINLALALSEANQRVTVVEADLRRPKVTRYLGMVSGVGLTNVLAGTAELADVTQGFREGMLVIAAGPTPPNPGELLASSHMAALLDKLRGQSDYVLIDAPPLLPVADASGLAVHTDGVLLSVRYGATRKEQVNQAAVTLQRVGAKVLGVVLNIVPPKAEMAQAYGYGYGYSYEAEVDGSRWRRKGEQGTPA